MEHLGRYIIVGGFVRILAGVGVILLATLGVTLGRLPGAIGIYCNGGIFHLPIATSLVVSIILTIALNALLGMVRKYEDRCSDARPGAGYMI